MDGKRRRIKSIGMEDDVDEKTVLDFHTAFKGSLFEKCHVSPLQLAVLDTCPFTDIALAFFRFLSTPWRIRYMRFDPKGFANLFGLWYCRFRCGPQAVGLQEEARPIEPQVTVLAQLPEEEAGTIAQDLVHNFVAEFLGDRAPGHRYHGNPHRCYNSDSVCATFPGSNECKKELLQQLVDRDGSPLPGQVYCFANLLLRYSVSLKAFAWKLGFRRYGRNALRENDEALAHRMFERAQGPQRLIHLIRDPVRIYIVDYDLISLDGQHLPLRIWLWERITPPFESKQWFAGIHERDTGKLLAQTCGYTHYTDVTILSELGKHMEEKYKPHGDIPTSLRRCWSFGGGMKWVFRQGGLFLDEALDREAQEGGGGGGEGGEEEEEEEEKEEEEEEEVEEEDEGGGGGGGGGG
ncbi:hypothetical protein CBR_g50820 [Chara braunii]|uniref:Uncharacterized protein n=1 Tax=Chara braunii TaxID=69332 RepID=A0A388M7B4_CHABU|nr:hypothetical protein CBR_g50820 [Chara braunii]|eukprot:GBG90474.1 hypothetical protein CBR_g50820 [Chara braunii]